MHIHSIVKLMLLLLAVTSCFHDPPCNSPSKDDNIELRPQWAEAAVRPPRLLVQCYPRGGGAVAQNFIPPAGGNIYLPTGIYDLLLYNTSPVISFRNMEILDTAEAYVEADNQPDYLYAGNVADLSVKGAEANKAIEVPMQDLVYSYPFFYIGLEGLQYVDRIHITVNGLNQGVVLRTHAPTADTYAAHCPYTLTTDGLQGTLHCFGHGDTGTKHLFTARFDYGQQTLTRIYDVTEMLNQQDRIVVRDSLVFEPPGDGGIDTGVGGWTNEVVDVPITNNL